MKNKILSILITILTLCTCMFTLTACGENEPPHTHVYDQQIVNDTFKASEATCEDKAEYYYSCSCGEKGTETFENGFALGHAYGDWVSIGNGQHEKTCANDNSHTITENCSGGNATCTMLAKCSVCTVEYGVLKEHNHNKLEKDATGHWTECVCGDKANIENHIPGAEATETTDQKCTECDYVIVPALGHVHTLHLTKVDAKTQSCTEEGNIEYYTCSCNKWFTDNTAATEITDKTSVVIAKDAHNYSELKYNETGHWNECVCGDKDNIENHIPGAEATETTDQKCTECDYVIVPALGHVHTLHLTKVDGKSQSFTEDGNIEYYTCSCNKWFTDNTAATEITDKTSVVIAKIDVNQIVATVCIVEDAATENIYKKDLIVDYLNYGYMYEQYGYTRQQIFEMILNGDTTNKVCVQYIINFYANEIGFPKTNWDAESYLTLDEKIEATYLTYKYIDDVINGYILKDTSNFSTVFIEDLREIPNGATNKQEELTIAEKRAYIDDGIDINSTERHNALIELISILQNFDLLGEDYDTNDITSTYYFKRILRSNYEQQLILKFEEKISTEARSQITYEQVAEEYLKIYSEQKEWTMHEFIEALYQASPENPILYSGFNGFGFVYHILLGASDELQAELYDWDAANPNASKSERSAKRAEIYSKIMVEDLRSSWIKAGYDFDFETQKFTGDYTLTSEENSLPFIGEIIGDNIEATQMNLSEFIVFMEQYLYGEFSGGNISDGREVNKIYALEEFEQKIRELMFTFSTDNNLNTYKGYVITPMDGDDSGRYIDEFYNASLKIMSMGEFSYILVASDYGYHVIFLSEKIDQTYDYNTLESFLNKEYGEKTTSEWKEFLLNMIENWDNFKDTNNYLYILHNKLSYENVNKAIIDFKTKIMDYINSDNNCVVEYKDRYADLWSFE